MCFEKVQCMQDVDDIINNTVQESLNIYGQKETKGIKTISPSKINKKSYLKKSIHSWTSKDFASYIFRLYTKKFKQKWEGIRFPALITFIQRIRQNLQDYIGIADNIVTKDYLDFFFDQYASYYARQRGNLVLSTLIFKEVVQDFEKDYDYQERFKFYQKQDQSEQSENEMLSQEGMSYSYKLSISHFIADYGIILAVNFITICEKKDPKQVLKMVANALISSDSFEYIQSVQDATHRHSPYPDFLMFKKYQDFVELVNKRIKNKIEIDVKFQECDKISRR